MTKRTSTPAGAVLVAIDMSKHRQEVLIERPEGGRRRRMTIMATKADYDRLADDLSCIGRPVVVGFEATGILAEAGDLRRFAHHRQFLKFCGLDLATCQSGTFRGRTKLSKYGNARLRRTFWMATQVAIRQRDNSFRDKLGRYVAGHGNDPDRRRKAMTALTAKMARVAHAVIKTGAEYRPFVERADTRWKDPSLLCREGATATL